MALQIYNCLIKFFAVKIIKKSSFNIRKILYFFVFLRIIIF